jgi:hypothetical protein
VVGSKGQEMLQMGLHVRERVRTAPQHMERNGVTRHATSQNGVAWWWRGDALVDEW